MRYICLFISIILFNFSCGVQAKVASQKPQAVRSIAPIVQSATKSVVNLIVHGELPSLFRSDDDDDQEGPRIPGRKFKSYGSGVVIVEDKNTYIMTNAHIVQYAKKIFVTLHNGKKVLAKVIGSDKATDIAILKINSQKVPRIILGDSDKVKVGDFVAAIGNPFHLGVSNGSNQTVTFGIVSALNRSQVASTGGYYDFIQSDAAVNPGSSGGALIDMHGKLIGITTALLVPSGAAPGNVGVSFAIPINMAKSIMAQIIKYGSVKRASLGTIVQNLTPELAPSFNVSVQKGALITQITKNSPAAKVGLKRGDVIIKMDKENISNASQVRNRVAITRIGSKIKVVVIRKSKQMTFDVEITEKKQVITPKYAYLSGLKMQNITEFSPIHDLIEGVQLHGISEITPAYSAGLKPGDIIIEANHIPVKNMKQLQKIANNAEQGLLILALRGQASFYALLKKEESIKVK